MCTQNCDISQINLKNYDQSGDFDDYWRVRISSIKFTLLQADGKPVPSPGRNIGEEIRFEVTYPPVFNDTNQNGEIFTFIAQDLRFIESNSDERSALLLTYIFHIAIFTGAAWARVLLVHPTQ